MGGTSLGRAVKGSDLGHVILAQYLPFRWVPSLRFEFEHSVDLPKEQYMCMMDALTDRTWTDDISSTFITV